MSCFCPTPVYGHELLPGPGALGGQLVFHGPLSNPGQCFFLDNFAGSLRINMQCFPTWVMDPAGLITHLGGYTLTGPAIFNGPVTITGPLQATGGGYFSGTSQNAITAACCSDRRLKEDVQDYAGGLETVRKLRAVTYKFGKQAEAIMGRVGEARIGVIAQEVADEDARLVTKQQAGSLDDVNMADLLGLFAVLLSAVQELDGELRGVVAQLDAGAP